MKRKVRENVSASSTAEQADPPPPHKKCLSEQIVGGAGTEIMMFDNVHVHLSHNFFIVDFTYPTIDGLHTNKCQAKIPCLSDIDEPQHDQLMLPFAGVTSNRMPSAGKGCSHPNPDGEDDTTDFVDNLLRDIVDKLSPEENFVDTLIVEPENVFLAQLFTAIAHTRIVQQTGNIIDNASVCGWECVAAKNLGIWWHFASPKHVGALYGVGENPIRKWATWEQDNFPAVAQEEGKIFSNPQQHFRHVIDEYNTTVETSFPHRRAIREEDFPPESYQCLLTPDYLSAAVSILGDTPGSLSTIVKLKRANIPFT